MLYATSRKTAAESTEECQDHGGVKPIVKTTQTKMYLTKGRHATSVESSSGAHRHPWNAQIAMLYAIKPSPAVRSPPTIKTLYGNVKFILPAKTTTSNVQDAPGSSVPVPLYVINVTYGFTRLRNAAGSQKEPNTQSGTAVAMIPKPQTLAFKPQSV